MVQSISDMYNTYFQNTVSPSGTLDDGGVSFGDVLGKTQSASGSTEEKKSTDSSEDLAKAFQKISSGITVCSKCGSIYSGQGMTICTKCGNDMTKDKTEENKSSTEKSSAVDATASADGTQAAAAIQGIDTKDMMSTAKAAKA